MCRKWTGALVTTDLILAKAQVTPDLHYVDKCVMYQSSPGNTRAFCRDCGSSIAWYSEEAAEYVVIFVGTLDEEHLVGKVLEHTVTESKHGTGFDRGGSFGKILTTPSSGGNLFWQNIIPGVTDKFPGPKFLQSYVGKEPLSE